MLFYILLPVPLVVTSSSTESSSSLSTSRPDHRTTSHIGTNTSSASTSGSYSRTIRLPSPSPPPCPPSQSPCSTFGFFNCFDPKTHQCCAERKNLCKIGQTCVELQFANQSHSYGCCPSGFRIC